jgi:flagellum-specific peptidoglycan hydrolase FlgJ
MMKFPVQRTCRSSVYFAVFFAIFLYFGIAQGGRADAAAASEEKELVATPYVTTAYYLNVRAEASAKSKILNVLKKGSSISVVGKTENGWLQLADGTYVHGAYAEPAGKSVKETPAPAAKVRKLAADPPRKPASQVVSDSGLTEEAIRAIFQGTGLAGNDLEKAVLEIEEEYGINAYFTIAVMKLESGNGNSKIAKNKNNLFGLNSSNGTGYLRFKTKVDSVKKFGQLISKNYIGKGYTTIEKIGRKYCPANSKWPGLVKNIINRDYARASPA